ncbi:MAG: hypothetical protein IJ960_07750 [Oscillospiraceae bacterium]|nr:hypothetical protein [Oscillospiraceae bacterium]
MNKVKITGKVLVIQLGREETRIVLMSKGSEILRTVTLDTPAEAVEDGMIRNPDVIRQMLKSAIKEDPEFKRVRQVIFSLRTSQVITENVEIPELNPAKTEKLIESNMDTYFPVDVQDYRVVWQVLAGKTGENGSKYQCVQLWAVPNAILARYYKVANDCGLSVAAIDYCGNSLATAVGVTYACPQHLARMEKKSGLNMEIGFGGKKKKGEAEAQADSEGAVAVRTNPSTNLYVSLDRDLLGMTFSQNGRVVYQRFVRSGSEPSYQFGELAMMLEYYQSMETARGSTIRGVVVGSLAEDETLVADLQDALGVPLGRFRGDCAPGLVFCVGAARTAMDFGIPSLNKLASAGTQMKESLWQYGVVLAGGLAVIAVFMMLMSSRLVWNMDISSLETTKQALQVQAAKVAGFADNYYAYENKYNSYDADWETVFSSLRTYNDNLVLMLSELEEIVPENSSVTNMQIAADGMNVTFACASKEEAAYLIMALRELKYADLNSISNLSGGGGGPATSYGSGEKAPTEGGVTGINDPQPLPIPEETRNPVADLIASELTEEELFAVLKDLTPEERDLLREVYGQTPGGEPAEGEEPKKLDELKQEYASKPTAEQKRFFEARRSATRTLLTMDPFAADRFLELLEEDYAREEDALLWWMILDDLATLKQQGKLDLENIEDVSALRQQMDILVDVLVQDEDHLTATEDLICTDSYMELSYLYYLEVALEQRQEEELPWLNVDKVIGDMIAGGFNTGSENLDETLDNLISEETRELVDSLDTEEGRRELLEGYFSEGTTGNPYLDNVVSDYLTNGTSGSAEVDRIITEFLAEDQTGEILDDLLDGYISTGTTGNPDLDALISDYLDKGTTGNDHLDKIMGDFIDSAAKELTSEQVEELLNSYLTEGTTGSPVYDDLLKDYLTNNTTGIPELDAVIGEVLENMEDPLANLTQEQLTELMNKYLEDGTTGIPELDELLLKYVTDGTTGRADLDKLIDEAISDMVNSDDPTAGLNEEKLEELMNKYLTEGTTGLPMIDALIFKYITTGTTGNADMDKLILDYLAGMGGDGDQDPDNGFTKEQVAEMMEKYLEDGTTGNPLYDELIANYLTTGTTGNPDLDKLIEDYLKENPNAGFTKEQVAEMIEKYLEDGTTGNPLYDELIRKYLEDGSTGNPQLDKMIEDYMKDLLGGDGKFTPELIGELMDKYLQDGTTGNPVIDKLIYKYITEGTTGNAEWDKMITDYLKNLAGGGGGGGNGGNGGFGGGMGNPQDTRIFFTVSLGYKDELKAAELARKGLYYDAKISKLEVEE